MTPYKNNKAVLVYQAGIANVFKVECFNLADYGRDATRLYQGCFQDSVSFTQGLAAAGYIVKTAHCNMAGDIKNQKWSEDLENAPFSESIVIIDTSKGVRI